MKKLLFINDTSKSLNIGCQVTMHCINRWLNNCKYEVTRFPLEIINSKWFKKIPKGILYDDWGLNELYNNWIDHGSDPMKEYINYVLDNIFDCDFIIANGEGSIIRDKRHTRTLLYILYIAKKIFGKKIILFNFTSDLQEEGSYLGEIIYPLLDWVSTREMESYSEVKKYNANVQFIPDMVLTLRNYKEVKEGKYILLGGSSYFNTVERKKNIKYAIALYQDLVNNYPQYKFIGCAWNKDDWLSKIEAFNYEYVEARNWKHYARLVRDSIMNITGRHHGIILSYVFNIPYLAFEANCHKTKGDASTYIYRENPYEPFSYLDKSLDIIKAMNNLLDNECQYKNNILNEKKKMYKLYDRSNNKLTTLFKLYNYEKSISNFINS